MTSAWMSTPESIIIRKLEIENDGTHYPMELSTKGGWVTIHFDSMAHLVEFWRAVGSIIERLEDSDSASEVFSHDA